MNFLITIIDALVGFVQRNPLTTLVILILAVGAPALLKGVALFFLYFIMGIVILGILLMLLFRWRIHKMRRTMEDQFGTGYDNRGAGGFGAGYGGDSQRGREGEVRVHKTPETPEKRVSKSVGDYVEFEETKNE